jgi:hypothetical protein
MFENQFYPGQPIQFQGMQPFRNPWYRTRMIDVIQRQGLTTNLKLCLDAADGNSLPAASTKWLDTSGNGYDFFLGTTGGADATDPTITGSQDGRSSGEYLSHDTADFMRYDTTNETWMQNLHKDNAIFTLVSWVYMPSFGGSFGVFGTRGAAAGNTGTSFTYAGSALQIGIQNAGTSVLLNTRSGGASTNTWTFSAVSLNEATGANGCIIQVNGSQELFTSTYASPAAGNASFTAEISARGNGNSPLSNISNGARMAAFMAWEGTALTSAQLNALFTATRGRFGV